MTTLHTVHGRIVDLHRYVNAHRYGDRPHGPMDRYELWIKPALGAERKFTIDTRTMPARRGNEVSLIVTAHREPQVLGLANWSTIDGINYARTEAPSLLRVMDVPLLLVVLLMMAMMLGNAGMLLFVPVAVAYILGVSVGRSIARTRRARQVDRAIDVEAKRTSGSMRNFIA